MRKYYLKEYKVIDINDNSIGIEYPFLAEENLFDALLQSEQPDISAMDLRNIGFPRYAFWWQNILAAGHEYVFMGDI